MIDHLHGRQAIPENIGPVRRLWVMTLLGEPPAASTTSMQPSKTPGNQLFCDGARYARVAKRFVLM